MFKCLVLFERVTSCSCSHTASCFQCCSDSVMSEQVFLLASSEQYIFYNSAPRTSLIYDPIIIKGVTKQELVQGTFYVEVPQPALFVYTNFNNLLKEHVDIYVCIYWSKTNKTLQKGRICHGQQGLGCLIILKGNSKQKIDQSAVAKPEQSEQF